MSEQLSSGLIRLLEIEILNETDETGCSRSGETGCSRSGNSYPGGVTPATLASCLDSLRQGLELESEGLNTGKIREELETLIIKVGGNTLASDFVF